jgi:dihydropteroate synthase
MKSTDCRGPSPERLERIILKGLRSFFADPRHFERVVFSARHSAAQLATKLMEIDRRSDVLEQTASRVLVQISRQKMPEDVGAAILGSTHEHLRQMRRKRAALEVHEAWLGKEIATLEAFEQDHPWCRLYQPQPNTRAEADLRELFVESVVVNIRSKLDSSSQACSE